MLFLRNLYTEGQVLQIFASGLRGSWALASARRVVCAQWARSSPPPIFKGDCIFFTFDSKFFGNVQIEHLQFSISPEAYARGRTTWGITSNLVKSRTKQIRNQYRIV